MIRGQTLIVDGGWSLLLTSDRRLAHEALAGCRDERDRLGEEHAHRVAERDRLRVGRAVDLHLAERRSGQLDRGVERQRRELLALRLLHGVGLLLGELAQRAEEILGIATAEREEASSATFHALQVTSRSTR